MYSREYLLRNRSDFKLFPEKCDLCKEWHMHMNFLVPKIKTHQLDDLHLCDHCLKCVFIESPHTEKKSIQKKQE
jgi:hypothetical protein